MVQLLNMKREEVEKKYQSLGLETKYITDQPNTIHKPDKDIRMTFYTLAGSIKVKIEDGDWQEYHSGDEFVVEDGQLHEAQAGPEGWEYIVAWATKS